MIITDEIFCAFLKCETKSYLKSLCTVDPVREFSAWQQDRIEDYRLKCAIQLRFGLQEDECILEISSLQNLENTNYRFVIDCKVQAEGTQSHIHALERLTSTSRTKHSHYIPIRFVPNEKITQHDKLLLAFDALVLYNASGKVPPFGKIIHGSKQIAVKVKVAELIETARVIVKRIATQQTSPIPPQLILNKHCTECEFQLRCRQNAIEKDELHR